MAKVLSAFEQYAKMSHHLAFEGLMSTLKLDDADRVADILSAHLMVATTDKQTLLELLNPYERLQRLHDLLDVEIEKINIDKRINVKVKKQMEKAQKEYYLNEKIKAIHQELGRKDDRGDELLRAAREDREGRPAQGSQGEGRPGAQAPGGHAAGLGRGHGLPQLHRLAGLRSLAQEEQGEEGSRPRRDGAQRGPLRPGEDQGPHPRVPGRAPARRADQELDHLLRRPSGRRQVVARQVDRPGHGPQVRPPVAGRRARRGGDPGPPPDLHRRLPGPDHPDDAQGRDHQPHLPARRGRQDVHGLPGRPVGRPAGGAGPRAERRLHGPLPGRGLRPLEGHVHRHGQRDPLHSGAAARTAWRSSSSRATRSTRSWRSPSSSWCRASSRTTA